MKKLFVILLLFLLASCSSETSQVVIFHGESENWYVTTTLSIDYNKYYIKTELSPKKYSDVEYLKYNTVLYKEVLNGEPVVFLGSRSSESFGDGISDWAYNLTTSGRVNYNLEEFIKDILYTEVTIEWIEENINYDEIVRALPN